MPGTVLNAVFEPSHFLQSSNGRYAELYFTEKENRFGAVRQLAQSHIVSKWQHWDWNSASRIANAWAFKHATSGTFYVPSMLLAQCMDSSLTNPGLAVQFIQQSSVQQQCATLPRALPLKSESCAGEIRPM